MGDVRLAMPIEQVVAPLPMPMDPDQQPASLPPAKANLGIIMVKEPDLFALPNSICGARDLGLYFLCTPDGRLVLPYLLIWSGQHQLSTMRKPNGVIFFQLYDNSVEDDQFCRRCGLCLGFMGVLGADGSMLIAPDRFKEIHDFHEGLAVVMNARGKYGFCDEQGCEVIPCQYDHAENFQDGKARVRRGQQQLWIDIQGKVLH